MSNERTITITVLASQKELAQKILKPEKVGTPDNENAFIIQDVPALYYMQYYEAQDSWFTKALVELKNAGIAWDYEYSRGEDTNSQSGEDHLRFTETGEDIITGWVEEDEHILVRDLMEALDHPELLRARILEADAKLQVLPWTNQEEYGKRHKAARYLSS
jgi:hypothetical protein